MSLYNNVWLLNSIKLVSKGTCNLKEWLKIKVFEVPALFKLRSGYLFPTDTSHFLLILWAFSPVFLLYFLFSQFLSTILVPLILLYPNHNQEGTSGLKTFRQAADKRQYSNRFAVSSIPQPGLHICSTSYKAALLGPVHLLYNHNLDTSHIHLAFAPQCAPFSAAFLPYR